MPDVLMMSEADLRRFWPKVALPDTPDGCWVWTAARTRDGYGVFRLGGRSVKAHRASYRTFVGPIPDGLTLDHVCNNPPCVNPAHLVPATVRDNIMRDGAHGACAVNARKTHCPRGHSLLDKGNLAPWQLRRGERECLTCRRERQRRRWRTMRNRAAGATGSLT